MDPTIVAGGLKLVGGLFGRKKKGMTPQQSIMSTAAGARSAAEKYGFNALTLLQNSNATAGAGMDMGTPPLASLAVLGDIVEDTWGQTGQDKATAREHNKLQNDLLRLEVDRARGAVRAVEGVSHAGGGAITGARTVKTVSSPVAGDFLDEEDRGEAWADERDNTVSFQSHGQQSVVTVGPDSDEVVTGLFIEANNKRKARLAWEAEADAGGFTRGTPLKAPRTVLPGGLGGAVSFDDWSKLMPPKPKKRPKPQGTNPFVPLHMRSVY